MAKKHEITTPSYLLTPLEDIMSDRFGKYSKYIIQERALPDARDGLKPVQRRILYAMYADGNVFEKQHRKSAKTVGLVIGNYHPHGDSSVYDAMVRLSQSWKVNEPLIDMHGNNGSIDDDPAAAMRYTEARLSKISGTLLEDIDQDTVLFAPNFDDTTQEPTVLPARYPNLLVNGTTGIAAGYATNIPPHNLREVVDATIYRIQNPECSIDELMEYMKGPDFPTGGIVQGKDGIKDAFTTGKGRVVIRSKTEIIETKTIKQIIITEIPYEVVKSNMVKKMDDIRINKDIDGILDVRDESDRNGLRIVVDIKKDMDAEVILNYLLKNTDLQIFFNYNMVAIVNKRPVLMGVKDLLDAYIHHREDVIYRRSIYQLGKIKQRMHILEGLMKAVSVLDEVIALIRSSLNKQDAKNKLMEAYSFSDIQAEAIVTLRLYRLTSTDITELREEFAQLANQMELLNTIIQSNKVLRQVIVKELKEVKEKYGKNRLSLIQDDVQEIVIDKLSMISNERVMFTLSYDGYLKRVSLRSFNASENQMTGIKESDQLLGTMEVDTLDTLLAFSDQGNYAYLPIYQIEDAKWKDIGSHINNYVKTNSNEKWICGVIVKNFDTNASIVTISKNGMIKRTMINEYPVQRNSKTLTNMNLKKGDSVIRVLVSYGNEDVVVVTKMGYVNRYSVELISPTACKSQGIKAINLSSNDSVADLSFINDTVNALVLMNDKGGMKRIKATDIVNTARAIKGETLFKKVKSNPVEVKYIQSVSTYDTIRIMDNEIHDVIAKDVTLMQKDATFSSSVTLSSSYYIVHSLFDVKITDFKKEKKHENEIEDSLNNDAEELEEVKNDFEMMSFDL